MTPGSIEHVKQALSAVLELGLIKSWRFIEEQDRHQGDGPICTNTTWQVGIENYNYNNGVEVITYEDSKDCLDFVQSLPHGDA